MKNCNIRTVAAKAGVSPATASRVFNGNARVAPERAAAVLEAAHELGYHVSMARETYARQIVYVLPALSMTYYAEMLDGAVAAATAHGMSVTVKITRADHEQELACLREACTPSTAGIIYTPATALDPIAEVPALRDIPLILTGPRLEEGNIPNVYQDSISAGYLGTKYLLRLGHRRIVFVANYWQSHIHSFEEFMQEYRSPQHSFFSVYDRFAGYCRALAEEELAPEKELVFFGSFSYESGCQVARRLLASSVNFDSLLAPNDRFGAGVMKILREQGIHVPDQVSLVCLTGGTLSDMVYPTMTSIETNNYKMGETSVEQIMQILRGEQVGNVRIENSLIIKNSTKAVR